MSLSHTVLTWRRAVQVEDVVANEGAGHSGGGAIVAIEVKHVDARDGGVVALDRDIGGAGVDLAGRGGGGGNGSWLRQSTPRQVYTRQSYREVKSGVWGGRGVMHVALI